ncbi:hypothetical protein ANANG_G00077970 [Anguilla anguilla]|uniref:Uncharacterized protein n=1 Tax=Anguilla anguilla TaxID=7936 RepID=A0A9D3S0G1_ANGAN|nr:hypothetical protein ANANG_G00077970 [Anguilla anguilla]
MTGSISLGCGYLPARSLYALVCCVDYKSHSSSQVAKKNITHGFQGGEPERERGGLFRTVTGREGLRTPDGREKSRGLQVWTTRQRERGREREEEERFRSGLSAETPARETGLHPPSLPSPNCCWRAVRHVLLQSAGAA